METLTTQHSKHDESLVGLLEEHEVYNSRQRKGTHFIMIGNILSYLLNIFFILFFVSFAFIHPPNPDKIIYCE